MCVLLSHWQTWFLFILQRLDPFFLFCFLWVCQLWAQSSQRINELTHWPSLLTLWIKHLYKHASWDCCHFNMVMLNIGACAFGRRCQWSEWNISHMTGEFPFLRCSSVLKGLVSDTCWLWIQTVRFYLAPCCLNLLFFFSSSSFVLFF